MSYFDQTEKKKKKPPVLECPTMYPGRMIVTGTPLFLASKIRFSETHLDCAFEIVGFFKKNKKLKKNFFE